MAITNFSINPAGENSETWWLGAIEVQPDAALHALQELELARSANKPDEFLTRTIGGVLIESSKIIKHGLIPPPHTSILEKVVLDPEAVLPNCVAAGQALAQFAREVGVPIVVGAEIDHVTCYINGVGVVAKVDNYFEIVRIIETHDPTSDEGCVGKVVQELQDEKYNSGIVYTEDWATYQWSVSEKTVRELCESIISDGQGEVEIVEVLAPKETGMKMLRAIALGGRAEDRLGKQRYIDEVKPHRPLYPRYQLG